MPERKAKESIWDYPRPPRMADFTKHIRVMYHGETVADTRRALKVMETSHPPVYYIPPADIRMDFLKPSSNRSSLCEWKGQASYYSVVVRGKRAEDAAWTYRNPVPAFAALKDCVAFYPSRMDACYVDDERAQPQPGDFYGGWITSEIEGPFKGGPGTRSW